MSLRGATPPHLKLVLDKGLQVFTVIGVRQQPDEYLAECGCWTGPVRSTRVEAIEAYAEMVLDNLPGGEDDSDFLDAKHILLGGEDRAVLEHGIEIWQIMEVPD